MTARPPLPGPVRNVDYPGIPRQRLANGMTVLCVEDHHLPRISVQLALPVGRISDREERLGCAQFVAEMLKEGTQARNSRTIAEALDRRAISFDVEPSLEHTLISMGHLIGEAEAAMELFAELVRSPSFPPDEFEKVRSRWLSFLISQRADPGFLVGERLALELFAGHPYAKGTVTPADLRRIAVSDLIGFHESHYSPEGSFLAFAGALSLEQAVALAEAGFGSWKGKAAGRVDFSAVKPLERKVVLIHRPRSTQTGLLIGLRGLKKSDPALLGLKLMNQIYGGGSSSRLFLNLREEKGYTYGAYSSIRSHAREGSLRSSASVRTDKTRAAIDEVFVEMERMQAAPPEVAELSRSRAEMVGGFVRRLETPGSIAYLELMRLIGELPSDYYSAFIPRLQQLSEEAVVESARRFLDPQRAIILVVSDRTQVEGDLAGLGPLSVVDADGHPLH